MAVATIERRYSPEDLLTMPGGEAYELVNGELVEKEMGAESGWIATKLATRLDLFCEREQAGDVFAGEVGYQCFADEPARVRKPDISFVRVGRLPGNRIPRGHIRIAPDLAVEVVSPNDLFSEVHAKVDEYLGAGVPLVWVIEPTTRSALVYRQDGTLSLLRSPQELDGEAVLPGFRCPKAEIFPPASDAADE